HGKRMYFPSKDAALGEAQVQRIRLRKEGLEGFEFTLDQRADTLAAMTVPCPLINAGRKDSRGIPQYPYVRDCTGPCQKSGDSPRSYGVFWQGDVSANRRTIFRPLNRLLRILFLVALLRLRAFLLHLSKCFCHVLNLIPNIKTYVDRRALL